MDNNTKEAIEQFSAKLDSYIQVLGEKLGVAAEYVYPILIKQQLIEAWGAVFGLCSFWIFAAIILTLTYKFNKKDSWDVSTPLHALSLVFTALGSLVLLFITYFWVVEIFTKFLNPEYAVIKDILQTIK